MIFAFAFVCFWASYATLTLLDYRREVVRLREEVEYLKLRPLFGQLALSATRVPFLYEEVYGPTK